MRSEVISSFPVMKMAKKDLTADTILTSVRFVCRFLMF